MSDNKSAAFLPIGMGSGIAIGAGLGVAMDNLALGMALGIAIGGGLGAAMMAGSGAGKKKDGDRDASSDKADGGDD